MRELGERVLRRLVRQGSVARASLKRDGVLLSMVGLFTVSTYVGCSGVDGDRPDLVATCISDDCSRGEVPRIQNPGAGGEGVGGQQGFAGVPSVGGGLGVPVPGAPPVDAGVEPVLGTPAETAVGGLPENGTVATGADTIVGTEAAFTAAANGGTGGVLGAAQSEPTESNF